MRARKATATENETPLFGKEESMQLLLAKKDSQIDDLSAENASLRHLVKYLQQQLYGASAETLEALGLQIEKGEEEEQKKEQKETPPDSERNEEKKPRKKPNVRLRSAQVKVIRLVPDEVRKNMQDYEELPLDETKDVTSRIVYIPGYFMIIRYETPRFRQRGKWAGKHIKQAKAPANTLGISPVSESVIAHVIFNKYYQHLPVYRTLREFSMNGLEGISENMLCHWIKRAAENLRPIWMAIHDKLLTEPAIHIDETPVRCLPGGGKKEKKKTPPEQKDKETSKKQGYMWTMCSASTGMAHYNWHWKEGRSQDALDLLLRPGKNINNKAIYKGCIITDGYTSYTSWLNAQGEKRIPQQLCWTHIRRKFVECINSDIEKEWCEQVLRKIAELYKIEKELKEAKADAKLILTRRTEESRPIVEEFYKMLCDKVVKDEVLMDKKLEQAIAYAATAKQGACLYLDLPHIPIDNNAAERAIRPLAIGRKNFLFIGAPDAGENSAILYTLAEECRRCGVNAETWFSETLQKIAAGYSGDYLALLPKKADAEQ